MSTIRFLAVEQTHRRRLEVAYSGLNNRRSGPFDPSRFEQIGGTAAQCAQQQGRSEDPKRKGTIEVVNVLWNAHGVSSGDVGFNVARPTFSAYGPHGRPAPSPWASPAG